MKTLHYLNVVCLLFLFSFNALQAQWVQTDGPYGGNIHCFAVTEGNRIFAGTFFGGVFQSSIGHHWTARNNGLMNLNVRALALIPVPGTGQYLLAGTEGDGVFISTNMGSNWYSVNQGIVPTSKVRAFERIKSNVFAGTDVGVYRSTNNGVTWVEVNDGFENTNVYALAKVGTDLFAGVYGTAANGGGVYRSTDNGANWIKVNTGLTNTNVQAFAVIGTDLFVGTWGGGVFRTTDYGTSWSAVNSGLTNLNIQTLATDNTNLFAGTPAGVFISTNNGANWATFINNNGLTNLDVHAIAIVGSTIYAGTWGGDGVFIVNINGTSWTPGNKGLVNTHVYAMEYKFPYLFAGTSNNGVFRSTNLGVNWEKVNQGLTNTNVRALFNHSTGLYAGTEAGGNSADRIFKSTDDGNNWTAFNTGLPNNSLIRDFTANSNFIFTATNTGVYKIPINGTTWLQIINGFLGPSYNVYALASMNETIFAGVYALGQDGGGVYRSTDNGDTWVQVNTGLTNTYVRKIIISGATIYAATSGGVFRSTNNGTNWSAVNHGLTLLNSYSLTRITDSKLLVGTYGYGVFRSTDNVTSWNAVNEGLWNYYILSLHRTEDFFAGTMGSGVWRRHASQLITSVELTSNELPNEFVLEQNYPNPFNPSTNISFSIPTNSFVTLKIFDALGREVSTLISEELEAGSYTKQFNAEGFPSGVYFYRLEAVDLSTSSGQHFVQTRKLVLLK